MEYLQQIISYSVHNIQRYSVIGISNFTWHDPFGSHTLWQILVYMLHRTI